MRVRSQVDGAVGEVVDGANGRVCVRVAGEIEWWTAANVDVAEELDLSGVTPEQAAELLRRLEDASL